MISNLSQKPAVNFGTFYKTSYMETAIKKFNSLRGKKEIPLFINGRIFVPDEKESKLLREAQIFEKLSESKLMKHIKSRGITNIDEKSEALRHLEKNQRMIDAFYKKPESLEKVNGDGAVKGIIPFIKKTETGKSTNNAETRKKVEEALKPLNLFA